PSDLHRLWAAMGHAPNAWPPHQYIAMQAMRTPRQLIKRGDPEATEGEILRCAHAGQAAMSHQIW
ncbi:hypothetical protein BGW80DRAFT_1368773, partial [Lactifluus volemus]